MNLASHPVLVHPLTIKLIGEVLITVELRDILECLLSQWGIGLKVEDVLESFSQVLLNWKLIHSKSFKQMFYFLELRDLCSELNPATLHHWIQVYSSEILELLSNIPSHFSLRYLNLIGNVWISLSPELFLLKVLYFSHSPYLAILCEELKSVGILFDPLYIMSHYHNTLPCFLPNVNNPRQIFYFILI